MYINKQNWQYKGLIQWYPMIGITTEIPEFISGTRIENYFAAASRDNITTPIGQSYPMFNWLNSAFDTSSAGTPTFNVIAQNEFTFSFWYKSSGFSNQSQVYANNLFSVQIGSEFGSDFCIIRVNSNIFTAINDSVVNYSDFHNGEWNLITIAIKNGLARSYFNGRFTREDDAYHQFDSRIKSPVWNNGANYRNYNTFDLRLYNYAWSAGQVLKYYSSIKERAALYQYRHSISDTTLSILNSTTLHTISKSTTYNEITIHTSGSAVEINNNLTFYTHSRDSVYNALTLHTHGSSPINSGLTAYTYGYDTAYSGLSAYIVGSLPVNSGVDLSTLGGLPVNSGLNFHTYGRDNFTDSITLHLRSDLPSSGNLPIYIRGTYREVEELSLYTSGDGYTGSGNVPMFMYASASGTNSLYNTASLAVINSQTMDPRNELKLFVQGSPETLVTAVNLVAYNDNTAQNGVPMYINGPYSSVSGISLYTTTETGIYSDGSIQTNSSLLLYLNRDKESLERSTSLFMKVKEPSIQSCDFIIDGYTYSTNSATLYVEGSGIPENITNSTTMYVRGGN